MINTEMLARVRSFLDEATAKFYIDATEVYPALTEAQRELAYTISMNWFYVGRLNNEPLPKALHPLIANSNGTITVGNNEVTINDLLIPILVYWSPDASGTANADTEKCLFLSPADGRSIVNNKMLGKARLAWWKDTKILLNPVASTSAGYYIDYIKETGTIDGSTQPTIDMIAHDAVCERALWLLMKDRELEFASAHLQVYQTMLQGLLK